MSSMRRELEAIKKRLNVLEYSKHLTSDKWKEIREAALARAIFQCELCGNMSGLACHHVRYPKNGFRYDSVDNVLVVCKRCHTLLHGIRPREYKPGPQRTPMDPALYFKAKTEIVNQLRRKLLLETARAKVAQAEMENDKEARKTALAELQALSEKEYRSHG